VVLLIVAGSGEATGVVIAASVLIVLGPLITGGAKRQPVPESETLH